MFPVLFHYKEQGRIIPSLPSAWHSGMGGFLPPFSPDEEKPCFILPVPPVPFPFNKHHSPHSATAPVPCSAALWAFLSPGKSPAALGNQYFNFLGFSWRSTLAKECHASCFCCFLLLAGKFGQKSWPVQGPWTMSGPGWGLRVGILCFGKYSLCLGGFSCIFKAVSWCLCLGLNANLRQHHCLRATHPGHHSNQITSLLTTVQRKRP